jgi:hypothetical protein
MLFTPYLPAAVLKVAAAAMTLALSLAAVTLAATTVDTHCMTLPLQEITRRRMIILSLHPLEQHLERLETSSLPSAI